MRLGVDIGGTFTDMVLIDGSAKLSTWKVPSTPPDFERGVLAGLDLVAERLGLTRESFLGSLDEFVHGTTVTTNIILTKAGERVGMLTTAGFGDLYQLARQYRGHEQDPALVTHPVPLVPRADIEEVYERVDFRGRVVVPIDAERVRAAVRRLLDKKIRSFAICFLWSFRNPAHEELAKQVILEEAPDAYVAASYEACPLIGEYERLSTTAITAFTGPALNEYATRLERQLRTAGFDGSLLLMKSDGGLGTIENAIETAGQTIYSGPVAGVMGARSLGEALGEQHLITFDMGGTSTDVSLVHHGEVRTTSLQFIDRQALAVPMIEVTTVGAGGGSLGSAGPGGTLRVGPQSAGAVPGPACYGSGGLAATVTDANLILGLIDADNFLGGTMTLDRPAAERAIEQLAAEVGLTPLATAAGMFRVANSVMADAIRLRTVFAGLDPRTFTLVSYGGAGGLHAAAVAEDLGIRNVVVPRLASVFSAAGLISTDVVYTRARSTHKTIGADRATPAADLEDMNASFAALDAQTHEALDAHGLVHDLRELRHEIDVSYLRQILDFDVQVPLGTLTEDDVNAALTHFDERYAAIYGVGAAAPETGYNVKAFKVTGIGRVGRAPTELARDDDPVRPTMTTRLALAHPETPELVEVAVYAGRELPVGAALAGPALIEYDDTTVLVPSSWDATVDKFANLRITRGG